MGHHTQGGKVCVCMCVLSVSVRCMDVFCMCAHMFICVYTFVWKRQEVNILAVFVYHSPFYLFTEAGLLAEPGAYQFHYSAYLARFRDSQVPE